MARPAGECTMLADLEWLCVIAGHFDACTAIHADATITQSDGIAAVEANSHPLQQVVT